MKKLPFEKMPQGRKKLRKLSSLKKEAWRVFSENIRRKSADSDGLITCITCNSKVHWKNANASHFIHGHSKLTFMDDRNVHASCIRCNLYLSGNLVEYSNFMKNKYGWETVDALRELSKQIWKPSREELREIIERYK